MMSCRSLTPLVIVLASLGCGKKDEAPKLEAFPVRVSVARRQTLEDVLTVVGSLKAKDEATLYSRVPGKLVENLVGEGDRVRKGQAVALVQRDEVGVRYEPAPVPSTLDGAVGRVYLDRGAEVALNTPVALVVDDSQMVARAAGPERYAGRIGVGQEVRVEVDARPGHFFRGKVSRVSPVVDPATRSALIEARLVTPPPLLKSGMFAKLTVVTESHSAAIAVPVEALVDGGGAVVFVVKDGKAHKRPVVLGVRTEALAEVKSGLAEGEQVVTFGLYGLDEGSPVEVLPEKGPAGETR